MNFNGAVGDLGSKPGPSKTVSTLSIPCEGSEEGFKERCEERYKGRKILSSGVSKNPMGGLVWSARIEGGV